MNTPEIITVKQLQEEYLRVIPRAIKKDIESWINSEIAQEYIKKALAYELSDQDASELYRIGKQKGKMPRLFWLCCIYIHPLTATAEISKRLSAAGF